MKSMKLFAFAALMFVTAGSDQLLETDSMKLPEYDCPPGPKSGWGIRGDLSCEVVEMPIMKEAKLIAGLLEVDACYQFASANETEKMFRHRN